MRQTPSANPWITFYKPNPQARLRLFCFPYAGGGASIYRAWQKHVPAEIEILPVQLPGRESRLRDSAFTHVEPLTTALAEALAPYLEGPPFAFFGHSMGTLLSYELAHRLRKAGRRQPFALLLSARRAPQVPPDDAPFYDLPDPQLIEKLRELNGTPEQVLAHPELMELMLPLLRADFELNDTYVLPERPPLDLPLMVYGGLEDEDVTRAHLERWGELSSGPFRLRMFPGDHFYLHEQQERLTTAVAEDLLRLLPAR